MNKIILLFLITVSLFAQSLEKKENKKIDVTNTVKAEEARKDASTATSLKAEEARKDASTTISLKAEEASKDASTAMSLKALKAEKKELVSDELLDGNTLNLNDEILKYINIEGYLRTAMNYRGNLDLNSFTLLNERVVGSSKHMPTIKELKEGASSESTVSYNTRFRFSPNIIIGEYLRAVATVDIFDNKLYGDNEASLLFAKEAYFEGKTPLGLFSLGRIATHWGLGINRNSGKSKFSNYGNYIDQALFEVRDVLPLMPNLSVKLAYEVSESTPQANSFYINSREPKYDIEDSDDFVGFSLYAQDKMEGEELNAYLAKGNSRLNHGIFLARSWKDKLTTISTPDPEKDEVGKVSLVNYENNYLDYYTVDGFFEFYYGTNFDIKGELVYLTGTNQKNKDFSQWGVALQSNINFLMKTLTVGIDGGIASGNSSDDANPYNYLEGEPTEMRNNFTFNLDFDIDLIFFKEVYSLTNLYYVRPHIRWLATKNISLELWSVTSIALDEQATYGRDTYLGTEIDISVEYLNSDGLNFGLRSGVYLPGAGMNWLGKDGEAGGTTPDLLDLNAELAFSIQAFLIMKF